MMSITRAIYRFFNKKPKVAPKKFETKPVIRPVSKTSVTTATAKTVRTANNTPVSTSTREPSRQHDPHTDMSIPIAVTIMTQPSQEARAEVMERNYGSWRTGTDEVMQPTSGRMQTGSDSVMSPTSDTSGYRTGTDEVMGGSSYTSSPPPPPSDYSSSSDVGSSSSGGGGD